MSRMLALAAVVTESGVNCLISVPYAEIMRGVPLINVGC